MLIELSLETKPTNISCHCGICGKEIKKGEKRFKLSGQGYRASAMVSYHPECFRKAFEKIIREGEGKLANY